MNNKTSKLVIFILWLCGVILFFYWYFNSGLSFTDLQMAIQGALNRWRILAPIAFILVYLIRPLLLIPATFLTTLSGALFGPLWGILYTVIGENMSANVVFLVGKYFGQNIIDDLVKKKRVIPFLDQRIVGNQFMSILILRLLFMPFDLVGFMAGFRNMRQLDFALGTFLGIMPGLITFVLLGSSITDPKNLIFSLVAFMIGIAISYLLKKRNLNQVQKV